MDIPKLKDITKQVKFLKDYSALLVPLILALAAVLIFVLTPVLMGSGLKERMKRESGSLARKIRSLSEGDISESRADEGEQYQEDYAEDANRIKLLGKQSSQRPLLSYQIFPEPKDTSRLNFENFGQSFRDSVDGLLVRLNARDCPSNAELKANLRKSISSSERQDIRDFSISSYKSLTDVEAKIVEVICQEKAQSASVYVNPLVLSGYDFWAEYTYTGIDKAVDDCWHGQLAYWIIEDVLHTVGSANEKEGSKSVFTSPVKRILRVSFGTTNVTARSTVRALGDRPAYLLTGQGGSRSFTGRFSNSEIDVIHFGLSVVVRTDAVLSFMQTLCAAKPHEFSGFFNEMEKQAFKHNQITILKSSISPIDREHNDHFLHRYGNDAVARLDLTCEYMLRRDGYDEIKPESVKKTLPQAATGSTSGRAIR